VAAALAASEAGFMVVDGVWALVAGDYITPKTGPYAGRLGPWAELVSAIGVAPRSTLMKWVFVTYGATWLVAAGAFALGARWAWVAMLVLAVSSLWYLIFGSIVSAVVIVLLLLPGVRAVYLGGG
jgi:hypothetical protein